MGTNKYNAMKSGMVATNNLENFVWWNVDSFSRLRLRRCFLVLDLAGGSDSSYWTLFWFSEPSEVIEPSAR